MDVLRSPYWTSREARIASPRRRSDLIEDELDGQAILFDPASGSTHRLNETALAVWRGCDAVTPTREIAERLTRQFEVDFDTALDHVEQVVVLLAGSGLLCSASC